MAIINSELLSGDKSLEALKLLLEHFKEKYSITPEQLLNIISDKSAGDSIPLTVFYNDRISCLEIIVKYLKENCKKTLHEIAVLLNRNDRTIWSTYNNSIKKQDTPFMISPTDIFIPLTIFSSRTDSVLESLIIYLKDKLGFSFSQISNLLIKDYQTIYTSYKRAIPKNE